MPPAVLAGAAIVGGVKAVVDANKAAKERDRKGGPPPGTTRTFQDPTLTDTGYDPNKLEYGGRAGQADADAGWWRERQRENSFKADNLYNQANDDRNLSLQARGGQVQAANLMLDRAQGKNLVSDRMAGTARRDLTSRMRSGAASAMGPAALANAQSDALAAEAQGLGQINDAATTQAIQEKTAAEQAAFGAQTGIREGDLGSRNAGLQSGLGFGNLGAQYGQLENQVRANQNQVNLGGQQLLERSKSGSDALNVDVYNKAKQRDTEGLKMGLGVVTSLAQIGAGAAGNPSDPLAKSGIQTLGDDYAATDQPGDVNPDLAPGASTPAQKRSATGQQKPLDLSWTTMSPVDATPRPDLSLPGGLRQDVANIPITSDPKAKQEAFELGRATQAVETSRATVDAEKIPAAAQYGMGLLMPSMLIPAALSAGKLGADEGKRRKEEQTLAIEQRKEGRHEPEVTRARGLEISTKPPEMQSRDIGLSSDDMFVRPGAFGVPQTAAGRAYVDGRYPTLASLQDEPRASDPRAKKLGGVHDNEVSETLDATPAVTYRYRDSYFEPDAERPGERQAGFLTTDLEKTDLGRAVVERRPDGYDGYNPHRMIGLQHAEIRNLHERLRELEARDATSKAARRRGR